MRIAYEDATSRIKSFEFMSKYVFAALKSQESPGVKVPLLRLNPTLPVAVVKDVVPPLTVNFVIGVLVPTPTFCEVSIVIAVVVPDLRVRAVDVPESIVGTVIEEFLLFV
jgi:hypothetical protein